MARKGDCLTCGPGPGHESFKVNNGHGNLCFFRGLPLTCSNVSSSCVRHREAKDAKATTNTAIARASPASVGDFRRVNTKIKLLSPPWPGRSESTESRHTWHLQGLCTLQACKHLLKNSGKSAQE